MATILFEEWRDVVGYEKLYEVSNFGEVKSYRRNKILRPQLSNGYNIICLTKNKNEKSTGIHRLVAMAFIDGKSETRNMVDHIDRNPLNNVYTNLRWVSNSENQLNRIVRGCISFENKKSNRLLASGEYRMHIYPRYRVTYSISNRKVVSHLFKTLEEAELDLQKLRIEFPR